MLAAACAPAECVDWEAKISWGDSAEDSEEEQEDDDDDEDGDARMVVRKQAQPQLGEFVGGMSFEALISSAVAGNSAVASGEWVEDVDWGDDDTDDESKAAVAAAARKKMMVEHDQLSSSPSTLALPSTEKVEDQGVPGWVDPSAGQQATARSQASSGAPRVVHSVPAQLHRFVMPDAQPVQQLLFHRPRLGKAMLKGRWKLSSAKRVVGSSAAKRAALRRRGGGGASLHAVVRETELRASDGELLALEFSEENPPLVANVGMAAALTRLTRATSGSSKDAPSTPVAASSTAATKRTGGDDEEEEAVDETGGGFSRRLEADEASPLLEEIIPSSKGLMTAWCSELFRCPVFKHTPRSRDFLLVLEPRKRRRKDEAQDDDWCFVARDMGQVGFYVAGQTEPRVEVPPRGSKRYNQLQEPIAAFHIARAFQAARASQDASIREFALPMEELQRALFCNTKISQALLKRAVSGVLEKYRTEAGLDVWRSLPEAVDANDMATRFAPEDVCAYESSNAHSRRLMHLGMQHPEKLGGAGGAAIAVREMHRRCAAAKRRASDLRSKAKVSLSSSRVPTSEAKATMADVAQAAERRCKALERTLGAARTIHEALALAPTHLSSGFCDVRHRAAAGAVLRLEGLGDPTGRGDGFSFARQSISQMRSDAKKGGAQSSSSSDARVPLAESRRLYTQRIAQIAKRQREWLSSSAAEEQQQQSSAPTEEVDEVLAGGRTTKKKIAAAVPAASSVARPDKATLMAMALGTAPQAAPMALGTSPQAAAAPVITTTPPPAAPAVIDEDEAASDSDHELSDLEKDLEDDIIGNQEDVSAAAADREEAGELAKLRKEMAAEKALKEQQARQELANAQAQRTRLPFAVRKVRRWVDEHGIERVRVSFSIAETELKRVARATGVRLVAPRPKTPPQPSQQQQQQQHARPTSPARMLPVNNDDDFNFLGGMEYLDEEQVDLHQPTPTAKEAKTVFKFSGGSSKGEKEGDKGDSEKKRTPVKLNVTALFRKDEKFKAEQRLKKQHQHQEEAQAYHRNRKPKKPRSSANSRHELAHVRLAKLFFESILKPLFKRPNSGAFHKPVNTKQYPVYREKVERPVDLSTIRERNSRYIYRDRNALLAELELMAHNAVLFNGEGSFLATEAQGVLEQARAECEAHTVDLAELETECAQALTLASSKRQRRGGPKASGSSPDNAPPPKRSRAASPAMNTPFTTPHDAPAASSQGQSRTPTPTLFNIHIPDDPLPLVQAVVQPPAAAAAAAVPVPARNAALSPPTLALQDENSDSSSSGEEEIMEEECAV